MQHTAIFEEQVAISPRDMKRKITSIEGILLQKLQAKFEGRCSRHGFVVPSTMNILSRSMGTIEKGRFTGSITFHVQAEGQVMNPPDGVVVEGEVIRKNKMGMYVSYQNAIQIIVPRDLHLGRKDFEEVEIGETVQVEIKKARFQVNDPYILAVGLFQKTMGRAPKVNVPEPVEAEGEEAEGEEAEGEEAEGEEAEGEEAEGEEAQEAEGEAAEGEAPAAAPPAVNPFE